MFFQACSSPRGWDAAVNSPEGEMTNVNVMFHLSVRPLMGTDFPPLAVIVDFPTDTKDDRV